MNSRNHPPYHTDGDSLDGWRIVIYLTVEVALHHYNEAARIFGFEPVATLDHYPNKFLTRCSCTIAAICCMDGQWVGLLAEELFSSPGAQIGAPPVSEKLRGALGGAALGALRDDTLRLAAAGYGAAKALRKEKKS